MPSSVEIFELAGPAWLNLSCLAGAAVVFVPMGALIAWAGLAKRRWRDVALGLAVVAFIVVCVVWIPFDGPARLKISDAELVIDYRWPRPDQHVSVRSITSVDYHTILGRGRRGARTSQTQLRVSLKVGESVEIGPPGFRANFDNLRRAGTALAGRADMRMSETVVDDR